MDAVTLSTCDQSAQVVSHPLRIPPALLHEGEGVPRWGSYAFNLLLAPSVCLFVGLSVCLSVGRPSVCCLSVGLPVRLSSVRCPSVVLSVCLGLFGDRCSGPPGTTVENQGYC